MLNNQNQKTIYYYTDGNIKEKKKIKIKKNEIYYYEVPKILNNKSSLIVGITHFKKEKDEENAICIGENTFKVSEIKKREKIDGFIETSDGKYIAFYKENLFIYILLLILWILTLLIWNLGNQIINKPEINNQDNPAKEEWIIGGIDGTDVSLSPEKETTYNTYWGYQEISIDKTMKVPVVNKETNKSYAQFTLYDKEGNQIWQSVLIRPGSRDEWDAYQYYNGKTGTYIHDLKVMFYNPVYENNEIVDFIPSMFAATTPDFTVHIK